MKKAMLGALALSVAAANAMAANDDLNSLKIKKLQDQLSEQQKQIEALADALEDKSASQGMGQWFTKTTIGGYGEHHFNHKKRSDDQVDAHRFVIYIGHEFTEDVRFFSEFELEHGLAGESKPGEIELEQAYIEWDYANRQSLVMGQFLIPVGILNETHEPDTFYGVERNLVENKIIPTTWWETGVMAQGEIGGGLSYNLAVHSGLNVEEVDYDGIAGIDQIRSGRQKSAEAVAEDLAYTGRLKYTGVKGLEVALTYQHQQDISQGTTGEDNSADLIEAHAIYNIGAFGVRALWTEWEIDGELPKNTGQDQQEGYYVEGSYKVMPDLGVFARYSEYDQNAGASSKSEVEAQTFGLNYWLADTVVIKTDYQDVDNAGGGGGDSINLGIGWSY